MRVEFLLDNVLRKRINFQWGGNGIIELFEGFE